ncbi:MAG: hypothetical protein GXZ04_08245 [Clostridiales bacterium]|nr:hypothetical protein [Clostridiales bacterium]
MKTTPLTQLNVKKRHTTKNVLVVAMACFLLWGAYAATAFAEAAQQITWTKDEQSFIELPRLDGLSNAFVADSINKAIQDAAQQHLNTLLILDAGTEGNLKVTQQNWLMKASNGHDLFSVLLTAQGRMPNGRLGYQTIPLMFDLANGQPVGAKDIFLDEAKAREWIEDNLEEVFSQDLSNYLDVEALRPAPLDRLLVTDTGIGLYYPENSMSWLSGRSASIYYLYHELEPLLNLTEGSLLNALQVPALLKPNEQKIEDQIQEAVRIGYLPGLPVKLGDSLEQVISQHSLLHDPEGFPDGEKYQLEDDLFRGTVLLSRDGETISGIISQRMNLFGLITGQWATQEDTDNALSSPFITLPLTKEGAALYGLQEGIMSTYLLDQHELRLVFGGDGWLNTIWLQTEK